MTPANQTWPAGVVAPGGILDQIIAAKHERLSRAKQAVPHNVLLGMARSASRASTSFSEALKSTDRINIIAEIKKRSPSRGIIREDFDPAAIAESYQRGGAAAISVLAEEDFFDGSLEHLKSARQRVALPLLRKDFIYDSYQVTESAAAGADALLLIAAMLDNTRMTELLAQCAEARLDALVEIHSAEEMERAALAGASIIGVNNRDLRTFNVDLNTSISLAATAPTGSVLVAESGIRGRGDISRLRQAGFNAFLIGEHFMRATDPGAELAGLVSAV
jgi:indole-3-glycerol phosphate synthase